MSNLLVPRHAPGVLLHQDDDRAQLLAPTTGAVVSLDPLALALWEMCDGETTVQEMTTASCALFDAAPDTVERDITRVLTALEQQLLLEWVPHPADGSAR